MFCMRVVRAGNKVLNALSQYYLQKSIRDLCCMRHVTREVIKVKEENG